jgi:hypothetical protein
MWRPRFKMRRTEDLGQHSRWQDVMLLGSISTGSLLEGPLRQVSASHDKSPHRASLLWLRLGCGPRPSVRAWGADTSTTTRGGPIPHAMQAHQLAAYVSSWPRQEPQCGSARLRGHPIAIISDSATRKLRPRHSSTPYDELQPTVRP